MHLRARARAAVHPPCAVTIARSASDGYATPAAVDAVEAAVLAGMRLRVCATPVRTHATAASPINQSGRVRARARAALADVFDEDAITVERC